MRRLALLPVLAALSISAGGDAAAASDVPRLEHLPVSEFSDRAILMCACPGAVEFCIEWKEKWAQDAPDPRIRNQSVRECVVDFMSALTGRPWP